MIRWLLVLSIGFAAAASFAADVSVRDFGAIGDAVADDTAAFRQALAAAGEEPGSVVRVPLGRYLVSEALDVPAGVMLEGVWRIPTARTQGEGSTFVVTYGRNDEDGAGFLTLHANSTARGLTFFYPDQNPREPIPYAWTISAGGGDNISIVDCLLVNPWQGVDLGRVNAGRHYVRNLYGQPLRRGMFIDKIYDVGRVENVHFWPFWTWAEESGIREWLPAHGEAFIIGRTDWQYMLNTFCFGYRYGYRFVRTPAGTANGNFVGIGADATETAVFVEDTNVFGILVSNGEFVSMMGDDPVSVVVADGNHGVLQFSNCSFWGPSSQIGRIRGTGTLQFSNCNFRDWDRHRVGLPAFDQFGGNLLVNGCFFNRRAPQARIHGEAAGAIFTANRFVGPERIAVQCPDRVQIGLNLSDLPPTVEPGAIIIDDSFGAPEFRTAGDWHTAEAVGEYSLLTHWAVRGAGDATASFEVPVPVAGEYRVSVWVGDDPASDHAPDAPWTVVHADGETTVPVNLTIHTGCWRPVGEYRFTADSPARISTSNAAAGNVTADAVKLVPTVATPPE